MSVRRNALFNLVGAVIPLVVSLITIPIYLKIIGDARYGVLAIVWLLLGYFGLFDLGLGRATAQRIAALHAGTAIERAQTFWTALSLNACIGVVGGLLIWPIAAYFFGAFFKVDEILRPEIQAAVPWLVLAVPLATLSGVFTGALQGRALFLELNLISLIGTLLFQLLPLASAFIYGADLAVLLPAAVFARVLTLLWLYQRCRRHIFNGHSFVFIRAQAGHLLRFGGWVTVTAFVGPMMVVLDRFIIGTLSGAKAVTYYTVPFQLAERSTLIAGALSSALFPRFAAATPKEERQLSQDALQALLVVLTPLIVVSVLFIEPFLAWWITPEFSLQSAAVGRVILLGFWFNSLAIIPYAQLQARGRPDLVAKCHLVEVLPYFGLLYLGLTTMGMLGAAIVFTIRTLLDFGLLSGLAGILLPILRKLLAPLFLIGVAFLIESLVIQDQFFWLSFVFGCLLITALWVWWQAPVVLRQLVNSWLKALIMFIGRSR